MVFPISKRSKAMILMLCGSTLISSTGLIIRNMETAGALEINLFRGISLALTILLILCIKNKRQTFTEICAIGIPGLSAAVALAAAGTCFLQAITNTTVAQTLFITCCIPILTAALAWFFLNEKLNKVTVYAICCAAFGISLMFVGGDGPRSFYGASMALVTASLFSVYTVIIRKYRYIEMLPALGLSGFLISIFCLLILGTELNFTFLDLYRSILLGSFISLIPSMIFLYSSKHLFAGELTLFMLLEFSLGPLWVWIFINEAPEFWTLVGGALVISALLLRVWAEMNFTQAGQLKRT